MPRKHFSDSTYGFLFNAVLVVSAFGYFVDVFDLYIFSIVRSASLKEFGLVGDALTVAGQHLLNMQMFGMLLGGVFWGVLGDKKGRLSVLFGSILLYSVANIANGFVQDVTSYGLCRFVSGIGLAGELGAGITLVAESLPQQKRSIGTTFVASIGVAGAVGAGIIGELFPWRTTYMIGGFLGLALLIARGTLYESDLFQKAKSAAQVKRGRFIALFTDWTRFRYYLACILIGVPVWYIAGILLTLAPEIAVKMGISTPIKVSYAVMAYSISITIGDVFSGLLSHVLQTRKKIILVFLVLLSATLIAFFKLPRLEIWQFYAFYGAMGFFIGTWAVLITMTAELFGTNLRNTATSTVPNFIRGSTILLNMAVTALGSYGLLGAVQIVGIAVIGLAMLAVLSLPETYHRHLDFNEKV